MHCVKNDPHKATVTVRAWLSAILHVTSSRIQADGYVLSELICLWRSNNRMFIWRMYLSASNIGYLNVETNEMSTWNTCNVFR